MKQAFDNNFATQYSTGDRLWLPHETEVRRKKEKKKEEKLKLILLGARNKELTN